MRNKTAIFHPKKNNMYPYIEIFNREFSTYGICMLVGIITVFLLTFRGAKKYKITIEDLLIISGFALMLALPCGSILYAIVTYGIQGIIEGIATGNFNIFGGLVYYGALIGGVAGGLIGIKVAKVKLIDIEKILIPYIPIGHAIGRVGCVMAGCCHGMEYDGLFAIYYANSVEGLSADQGYFPVQLLEALINICICIILIKCTKYALRKAQMMFTYLNLYSIARFMLEFLRGDEIRGLYFGLSTSQWISIALFIISAVYLIVPNLIAKYNKKAHNS